MMAQNERDGERRKRRRESILKQDRRSNTRGGTQSFYAKTLNLGCPKSEGCKFESHLDQIRWCNLRFEKQEN